MPGLRLIVLGLLGLSLGLPGTALAHGGATSGTDYRSSLLGTPAGIVARIIGGDDRILIERTTAQTVVILGYGGEPYLRLDAQGTWQNARSPAVALNAGRTTTEPLAGSSATPAWQRLGTGTSVVFHDHRSHWMAAQPPARVRANPAASQRLSAWTIPVIVDGTPAAIHGDLTWVGQPRTWLWWCVSALLALCAVAVGWRSQHRLAIATVGGVAAAAITLVTGISRALDLPDPTTPVIIATAIAGTLITAAVIGAWLVRRTPVYGATIMLLLALLTSGAESVGLAASAFTSGLVPGPLPTTLTRILLAVALAGTSAAAAAAAGGWRALLTTERRAGGETTASESW